MIFRTTLMRRFRVTINANLAKRYYRAVYISTSDNVFVNLAMEDWLYKSVDFSELEILLLWKNRPCVVIGRHQNPWIEVDVMRAEMESVEIARRNSGGGAVYHDLNNLNLTFMCHRNSYNRKDNLNLVVKALEKEYGISTIVTEKDDICYKAFKISGTASKLGKDSSYHHCTLLVNSDKAQMSRLLNVKRNNLHIETNATRSKPSAVVNLSDVANYVSVDRLMTVIGQTYLDAVDLRERLGFFIVDPYDASFFGINESIRTLKSWDWIYGRTPKFCCYINISVGELMDAVYDRHLDKRICERHSDESIRDKHSNESIRDRHSDERIRDRHSDERICDRHSDERIRDKHSDESIRDKHSDERIRDRHSDKRICDRHLDKSVRDKHSDERIRDKHSDERIRDRHSDERIRAEIHVEKGIIVNASLFFPDLFVPFMIPDTSVGIVTPLIGQKFSFSVVDQLKNKLKNDLAHIFNLL